MTDQHVALTKQRRLVDPEAEKMACFYKITGPSGKPRPQASSLVALGRDGLARRGAGCLRDASDGDREMTKTYFHEIPYNPNVDDPVDAIVEIMAGADVDLDPESIRRLVREVRHVHRLVLSEWSRRNEPGWKPPRRLKNIQDLADDGPEYDYGDMAGLGLPSWDAWWGECWGTGKGNTGRFRDGSDIAKPPLVVIYHLCNRWWRRELGTAFWCDFRGWDIGDECVGRDRLEFINPAALFFVLMARAVNEFDYTVEQCQLVHNLYYRKLDTTIPD